MPLMNERLAVPLHDYKTKTSRPQMGREALKHLAVPPTLTALRSPLGAD